MRLVYFFSSFSLLVNAQNSNTACAFIFLPDFKTKIIAAKLRADRKSIGFKQLPEGTFIYLDGINLDDIDTIIQLDIQ